MEWPLASFQYATAVYPILSMKTDWFNSALVLSLLNKRFLCMCQGELYWLFILLLWISDQWPLVEPMRRLKDQWESPVTGETHQYISSFLKRSFLLWSLSSILLPFFPSAYSRFVLYLPPSLVPIPHPGLSIRSAVWTNARMLHIMCMTQQHQCWTTDLWISADVRNIQNVPHCFHHRTTVWG